MAADEKCFFLFCYFILISVFSPSGCQCNHSSDLQVVILESRCDRGSLGEGGLKEKYSPLPQHIALRCLELNTIPKLLNLSCSENLAASS